jgi:hypothetical protein
MMPGLAWARAALDQGATTLSAPVRLDAVPTPLDRGELGRVEGTLHALSLAARLEADDAATLADAAARLRDVLRGA